LLSDTTPIIRRYRNARGQSRQSIPWGARCGVFIDNSEEALELLEIAHGMGPEWIALHDVGHPLWRGATKALEVFNKRIVTQRVDTLAVMR
jgi:hypothetical protein